MTVARYILRLYVQQPRPRGYIWQAATDWTGAGWVRPKGKIDPIDRVRAEIQADQRLLCGREPAWWAKIKAIASAKAKHSIKAKAS